MHSYKPSGLSLSQALKNEAGLRVSLGFTGKSGYCAIIIKA
jgi:hypothetical protein